MKNPLKSTLLFYFQGKTDEVRTKLGFFLLHQFQYVGGEGFEPPKAFANGFTVRPGSPTPASARIKFTH